MKPFWKKIWVVGFVFEFCIWGLNAQQLLNPTLSSFSLETNVGNKMISCTSGETMTGLKNGNLHYVIEGIYVFKDAPDVGTSLMPLSDLLWRVFPNPAKGEFTISNEANRNEIKADIFHLSGIQVKTLMQRTHPDKATGYAEQFQQMKQCRDWIKDGIPPPTPTFKVNEQTAVNNSLR